MHMYFHVIFNAFLVSSDPSKEYAVIPIYKKLRLMDRIEAAVKGAGGAPPAQTSILVKLSPEIVSFTPVLSLWLSFWCCS